MADPTGHYLFVDVNEHEVDLGDVDDNLWRRRYNDGGGGEYFPFQAYNKARILSPNITTETVGSSLLLNISIICFSSSFLLPGGMPHTDVLPHARSEKRATGNMETLRG